MTPHWLHQLLTVGVDMVKITCPKYWANHDTKICVLSFCCISRSNKNTWRWLAIKRHCKRNNMQSLTWLRTWSATKELPKQPIVVRNTIGSFCFWITSSRRDEQVHLELLLLPAYETDTFKICIFLLCLPKSTKPFCLMSPAIASPFSSIKLFRNSTKRRNSILS